MPCSLATCHLPACRTVHPHANRHADADSHDHTDTNRYSDADEHANLQPDAERDAHPIGYTHGYTRATWTVSAPGGEALVGDVVESGARVRDNHSPVAPDSGRASSHGTPIHTDRRFLRRANSLGAHDRNHTLAPWSGIDFDKTANVR